MQMSEYDLKPAHDCSFCTTRSALCTDQPKANW